jgi:hypothetical protein
MAGFPNTPYVGQTYTVGAITWEWNGTAWTVKSSTTASIALTDLTDVTITTPVENQILKYNGSEWNNSSAVDGGSF